MNDDQQTVMPTDISWWRAIAALYQALSKQRRREFKLVLALMVVGGLAELATIGTVVPFLAALADPLSVQRFEWVRPFYKLLGVTTPAGALVASTTTFIGVTLAAGLVRLRLVWLYQAFAYGVGHDISVEIQHRILCQPYLFHVANSTSSLIAAHEKVPILVFVLQQLMQALTAAFISIFIISALIVLNPAIASIAVVGFALIYLLVSAFTRQRLARNSAIIGSSYENRVKIVQETLGGIRDVLIESAQGVYLNEFRQVDERLSRAHASNTSIGNAPRFVIEALAIVLIVFIALETSAGGGGLISIVPVLGALALGAQRLLPLVQQIYLGWSFSAGSASIIAGLLAMVQLPIRDESANEVTAEPLPLRSQVTLQHVSFTYPGRRKAALHDINLELRRAARLVIIGRTGSGKSTLTDLFMGFLEPDKGVITIDGEPLTANNRRRWQGSIAHVPQSIFLAHASIAQNIAFGILPNGIDLDRVVNAARRAQLHQFVIGLPQGYDTPVGERGVRLSGGQRQRLAIARAIYKDAPVLVLDEATSALDPETEAGIMQTLDELAEEGRTIIIIAHRPPSMIGAHDLIELDHGRVVKRVVSTDPGESGRSGHSIGD